MTTDITAKMRMELNSLQYCTYFIVDWLFSIALFSAVIAFLAMAVSAVIGYNLSIDWLQFFGAVIGVLVITAFIESALLLKVMD